MADRKANHPNPSLKYFDGMSEEEEEKWRWRCAFCYARKGWFRSASYRDNPAETPLKTPARMSLDEIRAHLGLCVKKNEMPMGVDIATINGNPLISTRMVYDESGPFLKECAELFHQFFIVFDNGKNGVRNGGRGMFDDSAQRQITEYNASFKPEFAIAITEWISILPLQKLICAYAEFNANWPIGRVFLPSYQPSALPLAYPAGRRRFIWQPTWEEHIAKWGVDFHHLLTFLMHPQHGVLEGWAELDLFLATGKLNPPPAPAIRPPSPPMREVALVNALPHHLAMAEAEVEWSIEALARNRIQTRASSKRRASELSDEKTNPKVVKTSSKAKSSAECASAAPSPSISVSPASAHPSVSAAADSTEK